MAQPVAGSTTAMTVARAGRYTVMSPFKSVGDANSSIQVLGEERQHPAFEPLGQTIAMIPFVGLPCMIELVGVEQLVHPLIAGE